MNSPKYAEDAMWVSSRRSIEDVSTGESTPQGVAVDTNGEQARDGWHQIHLRCCGGDANV